MAIKFTVFVKATVQQCSQHYFIHSLSLRSLPSSLVRPERNDKLMWSRHVLYKRISMVANY